VALTVDEKGWRAFTPERTPRRKSASMRAPDTSLLRETHGVYARRPRSSASRERASSSRLFWLLVEQIMHLPEISIGRRRLRRFGRVLGMGMYRAERITNDKQELVAQALLDPIRARIHAYRGQVAPGNGHLG
jgi:hypothetical protein